MITVMFEKPVYNVSEQNGQVEVCLTKTGENEIPVSVTVQPSETGSAEGKVTNQKKCYSTLSYFRAK